MSEKQKYIVVVIALPILVLIIYSTLISETLERNDRIRKFERDTIVMQSIETERGILSERIARMERILEQAGKNGSSDFFFSAICSYCAEKDIVLTNYGVVNSIEQSPYYCITRLVTFDASFHSLLFLLDYVEKTKICRIRALSFEIVRKREIVGLRLNMYTQFVIG